MRDVIELRDKTMPVVWSAETVGLCYLRAEVSENENSWLVWADQYGTDEQLEFVQRYRISIEMRIHEQICLYVVGKGTQLGIVDVKLNNNKIRNVRYMVGIAESEVS